MTGLLVSVRSAAEAAVALEGGADVIDVKEPRNGALGAADPAVWREIQAVVGGRAIMSAALGELLGDSMEFVATKVTGFRFAKVGLAGCELIADWMNKWLRVVERLPDDVHSVPVVYADLHGTGMEMIGEAIQLAQRTAGRMLLIDTFDKKRGGLLNHLSVRRLFAIRQSAAEAGVNLTLAGSLVPDDISRLMDIQPSYVGVRGAACEGGRDGTVDLARVKSLARLVHGMRHKAAS